MSMTTVFIHNWSQALSLPAGVQLPEEVKKVHVRARGMDRVISPVGHTWDAFFQSGPQASDDFMTDRAPQEPFDREGVSHKSAMDSTFYHT